ncbi:MAG TPA: alginate export family protein [Stellaceae bacterium]|nr:alginate export family protein [Stellaceae bacterium]
MWIGRHATASIGSLRRKRNLGPKSSLLGALASGVTLSALLCAVAHAQTLPLDPGPFPFIRYEQTCQTAHDLAKVTGNLTEYIPLDDDPGHCLSFGGEVKERYEHYTNELFGLAGFPKENYLLSRVLFDADLHLGENFRTFVQLGTWGEIGKKLPDPIARDAFDAAQAFVDVSSTMGFADDATLRAGQWEMVLGSGRLVSAREGPNTRQTFDGFHFFTTWNSLARIDAFMTRPTVIRPGTFDDGPDPHQKFGGLYGTLTADAAANLHVDGYYYLLDTTGKSFNPGPPHTQVSTLGSRIWGGVDPWDYDTDMIFQLGTQNGSPIRAGGIMTRVGYSFAAEQTFWRPRVILGFDYLSGNGAGSNVNTFNPLFSAPIGFYDSVHEAPSNLIDIYPSLKLHPMRTIAIQLGPDFNWRASTHDFVYVQPFIPLRGTNTVPGRYISTNLVSQATWTASPNLTLYTTLVRMIAGPAITEAHGKSTDYATIVAKLRF